MLQKRFLTALLAAVLLGAAAHAAPSPLISRDVLFGNPDRAGAQLSPDGKSISYLAAVDGVLNIWVGSASDPSAAKPVTQDTYRGIRAYFWAYTSQHIVYLQDRGGDENWRAYSVNLETGKEVDLTPLEGVRAQIQGVSPRFPEEILVGLNDRDPRFHDIYRIHLTSGERTLLEENTGFIGYLSDQDYNVRLALGVTPQGNMEMKRRAGEAWEPFLEIPTEDNLSTQPIGFDKSGKVFYMLDPRGRDTTVLKAIHLETGKEEVLASDDRTDVSGIMMHPTERTVQAVATTFTRREWTLLDKSIEGDLEKLRKGAEGDFNVTGRTQDDRYWMVAYVGDNGPVRYYRYDRKSGALDFLFNNRDALADLELARMHPRVISSRDGLELVSYLSLPPWTDLDGDGQPKEPLPMVLMVHGGPWSRDNWGFNSRHQWLANRGYAVLSVNYRGSTGFGKRFLNAADGEWSGKMHDDLIDAVDWAIEAKVADPDKVAIAGGSYGGYATLVGLTFTPDTFACGVDIVGPSNLITLIENAPPYWRPIMPMIGSRIGDISTPEGRRELRARSPLTHVEEIKKPLLIGQGANDPRVPQGESDQIVEAMLSREIPVTYVLYPDEGHGFRRPENSMSFNAVMEAFLAQHLGGRAEPFGDDFEGSTIQVPTGAEGIPGLEEKLIERPLEVESDRGP